MSKYVKNEKGLTLVELLAAFSLTAIIGLLAFSLLSKGMSQYREIATETEMRDEADYYMSLLMRELYTTSEAQITKKQLPATGTKNYYIEIKKDSGLKQTGFINNKLYIQGKEIPASNARIKIDEGTNIEEKSGTYKITLVLVTPQRNTTKKVEFESEIKTIPK